MEKAVTSAPPTGRPVSRVRSGCPSLSGRKTLSTAIAVPALAVGFYYVVTLAGGRASAVPQFELTNWDGSTVSTESLVGRRSILTFTFTKCVFGCPMITQQLKTLDRELGSPAELNYLHISVNPSADTPEEILKHFAKHDIDPRRDPRWLFLTGSDEETAAVLADFGIDVNRRQVTGGELIEHTIKVVVVDTTGKPIATFDTYHWEKEAMLRALRS